MSMNEAFGGARTPSCKWVLQVLLVALLLAPPFARAAVPAPKADHHLHILSEEAASVFRGPSLPETEVPNDIARLLQARAAAWNDADALQTLFADDAILVVDQWNALSGILRGAPVAAAHLSTRFGSPYRLTPVSWRGSEELAHVAGYYTRGQGDELQRFGYFVMALERTGDGEWRIVSESPSFPREAPFKSVSVDELIAMMDEAGVEYGVLHSTAAGFGGYWVDVYRKVETAADRHPKVRAENDWLAEQVAHYPNRLVSFCSFQLLEPYALDELRRCPKAGHRGLKLHFDEEQLDFTNVAHVQKMREVFALANELGFPIMAHIANNEGTLEDTRIRMRTLFDTLAETAPDIPFQIAHLWGGGSYSEPGLVALAELMASEHPGKRHVYIDIGDITRVIEQYGEQAPEIWMTVATQLRRIGFDRILFGSDGGFAGYHGPGEFWTKFVQHAPLTEAEFEMIATNVAPYLK